MGFKPSEYGGLTGRRALARSALLSPRQKALLAPHKPYGSISAELSVIPRAALRKSVVLAHAALVAQLTR